MIYVNAPIAIKSPRAVHAIPSICVRRPRGPPLHARAELADILLQSLNAGPRNRKSLGQRSQARLAGYEAGRIKASAAYYEYLQQGLGAAFLDDYDNCIGRIEKFSRAWTLNSNNCCRSLLTRFPFSEIFHIDGDEIQIVAIIHLNRESSYRHERG